MTVIEVNVSRSVLQLPSSKLQCGKLIKKEVVGRKETNMKTDER